MSKFLETGHGWLLMYGRRFYKLSRPVRFALVGVGGVGIGFVVYNLIYLVNPFEPRATIAWVVASLLAVWRQHGLHRLFTFDDRKVRYLHSLGMAYVAYSVGIVGSTALNWWLTEGVGLHHLAVWSISVVCSIGINYVLLERLVFRA